MRLLLDTHILLWLLAGSDRLGADARAMIDDSENDLLVAMLEDTFVETLRASEFGADSTNKRMLRVWWD